MHSVIIVGGWIMIIVETQLHSGNLESSQRNLEEVPIVAGCIGLVKDGC